MDLLQQCRQWFDQNEIQKVIDTLEAIPAGGGAPRNWTANWPRHISPLPMQENGSLMKRRWNFWRPMRSILRAITAGITGSPAPIITWTRKAPPCGTLKRRWKPAPETRTPRNT